MKTKLKVIAICHLLSVVCLSAFAQGTAFTYQGRLNDGGAPANGVYDLAFTLYATNTDGVAIAGPETNSAIAVSNGRFTTTVDFGNVFTGTSNWLEIAVSTNGGDTFSALVPRQLLTPVPYSVMANSASNLLGTLPAAQLSGTVANGNLPASPTFAGSITANSFAGDGADVTNVNATALNGVNATNFWQLGGNNVATGQFIGSANNQPLEFHVNGMRGLRLEPGLGAHGVAPNVIGGSPQNFVASNVQGATVSGGGAVNFWGSPATNSVTSDYGTVGGGFSNTSSGNQATVGGGHVNVAGGDSATVGGGFQNLASGAVSTVPGGADNQATGTGSFAAGQHAQALHQGTFVWADSQGVDFASTGNNQFLIRAAGGVGINTTHPAGALSVNTGAGTMTVRNDGGLTPGLDITSGYQGTLRLRNALEVWPSDDATRSGKVDVRDTNGNPQITLEGASGKVTAKGFAGDGSSLTGVAQLNAPAQTYSGTNQFDGVLLVGTNNVVASSESYGMRIIAGVVNADGSIASGTNFTVSAMGNGLYQVSFWRNVSANNIFVGTPAVTVTPRSTNGPVVGLDFNYTAAQIIDQSSLNFTVQIITIAVSAVSTINGPGSFLQCIPAPCGFNFVVVGHRGTGNFK